MLSESSAEFALFQTISCAFCQRTFSGETTLHDHQVDEHASEKGVIRLQLPCKQCEEHFASHALLVHHLRRHKRESGSRKCPIDGCVHTEYRRSLMLYHLTKARAHQLTVEAAEELLSDWLDGPQAQDSRQAVMYVSHIHVIAADRK